MLEVFHYYDYNTEHIKTTKHIKYESEYIKHEVNHVILTSLDQVVMFISEISYCAWDH